LNIRYPSVKTDGNRQKKSAKADYDVFVQSASADFFYLLPLVLTNGFSNIDDFKFT
jgi:hypothetical protein